MYLFKMAVKCLRVLCACKLDAVVQYSYMSKASGPSKNP